MLRTESGRWNFAKSRLRLYGDALALGKVVEHEKILLFDALDFGIVGKVVADGAFVAQYRNEILPGVGRRACRHGFGRTRCDHRPAAIAAFGPEIDQIVGGL